MRIQFYPIQLVRLLDLNRQHHLSLAINSELEELNTDLEGTRSRVGGARRRLDRVAKGVKGNGKDNFPPLLLRVFDSLVGSAVTIALLTLVLLILIIVFKT